MSDGSEPVENSEILYRRIPKIWYDDKEIDSEAFLPHRENDTSGISLFRAKYHTIEFAALSPRPNRIYYVASVQAQNLQNIGLTIIPDPLPEKIGHCLIPELCSSKRSDNDVRTFAHMLATKLVDRVDGPFGPYPDTGSRR